MVTYVSEAAAPAPRSHLTVLLLRPLGPSHFAPPVLKLRFSHLTVLMLLPSRQSHSRTVALCTYRCSSSGPSRPTALCTYRCSSSGSREPSHSTGTSHSGDSPTTQHSDIPMMQPATPQPLSPRESTLPRRAGGLFSPPFSPRRRRRTPPRRCSCGVRRAVRTLVAMPAYNEEAYIAKTVLGARQHADAVLVVDDGSHGRHRPDRRGARCDRRPAYGQQGLRRGAPDDLYDRPGPRRRGARHHRLRRPARPRGDPPAAFGAPGREPRPRLPGTALRSPTPRAVFGPTGDGRSRRFARAARG
jgi:hypothetical protein